MTELALRTEPAAIENYAPPAATSTMTSLVAWEAELIAAGSIAMKLCVTPFVPKHFRDKPADAAAAILTGFELGLSPMASLRAIFLIGGTPGMYAKAMVAVVQSKGHEVWIAEQSDDRVIVRGQRKGSDHVFETVWDRARVVKAKLTGNAKYQENPQQMMTARGQAEICRQVASDALHGIPYSVEELEDFGPERDVQPSLRVTAAEILGTAPAAIEPPPAETPPVAEPEALRPHDAITPAQLRMLHALLGKTGHGDRDKGLALLSRLLGREVDTSKSLTKTEASFVIDTLNTRPAQEPADESHLWTLDNLFAGVDMANPADQLVYAGEVVGHPVASLDELTGDERKVLTQKLADWMAQFDPTDRDI